MLESTSEHHHMPVSLPAHNTFSKVSALIHSRFKVSIYMTFGNASLPFVFPLFFLHLPG
jgi:hypothetical protein